MDLKTFFIKEIMMSFFVSITFILAAMALIGMIYEPDARFGYEAFLSPLIFGAITSFPLLVKYSRKELSLKQSLIRDVIHFVLLEVVVLTFLYFGGMLTDSSITMSVGFSIFIIDVTVHLVLWINDKRVAKEFNAGLKQLQNSTIQET
jgi:hypothetical protein